MSDHVLVAVSEIEELSEELNRLRLIELAAQNLYYVFRDLQHGGVVSFIEIGCRSDLALGLVKGSFSELAATLGQVPPRPIGPVGGA